MKKNLLFLDTTLPFFVLELMEIDSEQNEFPKVLFRFAEWAPKESSQLLFPQLQELKSKTKLEKPDLMAVGHGPGSFMGIRVGLSAAKTLAYVWNIPIVGVDSLVYTSEFLENKFQSKIFLALDGKMGKFFCHWNGETKDIPQEEVFIHQKQADLPLVTDSDLIQKEDIPSFSIYLQNRKADFFQMTTESHSYHFVQPNYLRGTYVDSKITSSDSRTP